MSKTLALHVKKEYFTEIKRGDKTEEYRIKKDYWTKRLSGQTYDSVSVYCGYPKRGDENRRILFEWDGYVEKEITHKHFGNNPVVVYAISLNKPIN